MDCKGCLTSSVWLRFLPKRMFLTCELCGEYGMKKTKTMKIVGEFTYLLYLILALLVYFLYNK